MDRQRIGLDAGDLRRSAKTALRQASEHGFRCIEIPALGELSPSNLGSSGRRHLVRFADGLGLKIEALRAGVPATRWDDARTLDEWVDGVQAALLLARGLRVPVVACSVGALTDPETAKPSPDALAALSQIGERADIVGVAPAIRPTRDNGEQFARVLNELDCASIGLCLDPAELVMAGANPFADIERYVDRVALLHVRDATAGGAGRTGHETPVGQGDVDWVGLLGVLGAAGYAGPCIVRRTSSNSPIEDIAQARDTIAEMLPSA